MQEIKPHQTIYCWKEYEMTFILICVLLHWDSLLKRTPNDKSGTIFEKTKTFSQFLHIFIDKNIKLSNIQFKVLFSESLFR